MARNCRILQEVVIFFVRHLQRLQLVGSKSLYNERFRFTDRFGFLIAFRPQDIHAGNAGIALKNAGKFYAPCFIQAFQIGDVPLNGGLCESVLFFCFFYEHDVQPLFHISASF